ncbi:class I SAM-dependent methyltransferase [Arthrobacter rhizosphaerae]|uniref:class I SAM-dependent methyltransferase n=1 Tax=Arthrobacter rhizosphaerae TaxID=2855490 RepID=UPI001FF13068|nr:class I SAM-dependent methyltransferase [Arthrobacter rhizosphaerae]
MRMLEQIDAINRRHPWSHNDFYSPWILRQAAQGPRYSALDIGCGSGNLVAGLRACFEHVTGIEPDHLMARTAQSRFETAEEITIRQCDFDTLDWKQQFDAITLVAVLHHLPLDESLSKLKLLLRPGGRLVVIGCYREATLTDRLLSMIALITNPLFGVVKHWPIAAHPPVEMMAPTVMPREMFAEIRRSVKLQLPGGRIRRRLFWRYSLVYTKPA